MAKLVLGIGSSHSPTLLMEPKAWLRRGEVDDQNYLPLYDFEGKRVQYPELAERVGVSHVTMSKVERGDPSVALGTAFEAAALVGVTLFDDDPARRRLESERNVDRLALLPRSTRRRRVDNDF